MLIKVCGLTNVPDARSILQAGADWIGLNLVSGPRKISLQAALDIVARVEAPHKVVALLQADSDGTITSDLKELRPRGVRTVQLYGSVSTDLSQRLDEMEIQVIHAVHGLDGAYRHFQSPSPTSSDFVLVDSGSTTQLGGTGIRLNWDQLSKLMTSIRAAMPSSSMNPPRIILAGGLTPENVAEAIRIVRPFGVDVSSGVESELGKKDPQKVAAFVNSARRVDRSGIGN